MSKAHPYLTIQSNKVLNITLKVSNRVISRHTFKEGEVTIGRDATTDLLLDNPSVSRQHAKIEFAHSEIFIIDNQSRNGTFLNGKKILANELNNGDVITIGKFELRINILEKSSSSDGPAKFTWSDYNDATVIASNKDVDGTFNSHLENHQRMDSSQSTHHRRHYEPSHARATSNQLRLLLIGVAIGGFLFWILS